MKIKNTKSLRHCEELATRQSIKMNNIIGSFLIFATISACTLAPKYTRPQTDIPLKSADATKKKIATISWQEFFKSPDLQKVIQLALDNNHDYRIANLNIESAQAAYGVARSNLLPSINAVGSETRQGISGPLAAITPKKQYRLNLTLTSYEVDFFGRLRSLKKSALENYLATEQARNITKIALISETANIYSQLLLDKEILEIAKENLTTQSDRYKFTELRYQNGIDSQADLLNAEALIEGAKTTVETYTKFVAQDKNALMFLTGNFDEALLPKDAKILFPKEPTINDIKIEEDLLDLIPSESLLARPDVQQAEHILKSANTDIGAARAAFFPSITLTGTYGYATKDLSTLFNSTAWSFAPQINLPIFSGGRNFANLKLANVRKKIEIAQYEKSIQTAFRETLDQLAEREATVNQLKSFDQILKARQKSYDISEAKHKVGISSALNVLDSKILFLTARQNQASMKKDYIVNLVNLYKVFGGGSEVVEEDKSK